MSIQVTIRAKHAEEGFRRAFRGVMVATDEGLLGEARAVKRAWGRGMRRRSGRLFRSRRIQRVGPKTGRNRGYRVYSDEAHAAVEERGSRAHIIVPRSPLGVLRFTVGGRVVFARSVRHPGMKGSRALARALDRSRGVPRILRRIRQELA